MLLSSEKMILMKFFLTWVLYDRFEHGTIEVIYANLNEGNKVDIAV